MLRHEVQSVAARQDWKSVRSTCSLSQVWVEMATQVRIFYLIWFQGAVCRPTCYRRMLCSPHDGIQLFHLGANKNGRVVSWYHSRMYYTLTKWIAART